MDIIIPIIILILLFITCSVCGYCCKRNKQGIVYGIAQPNVTTTTSTTYQSTPYPVMDTQVASMPTSVAPVGFAPHAAYPSSTPYPPGPPTSTGAPYPPANASHGFPAMPMPMAAGGYPVAPYPTMPMPGAYTSPVPAYPAVVSAHQLPPTYAEATQHAQTRNVNEGYSQQSPYNPGYN